MAARGGHWEKAGSFVRSSFRDEYDASEVKRRELEQWMAAEAKAHGARYRVDIAKYAGYTYRRYVITTKDGEQRSYTDGREAQQFIKGLGALQPKGERWQPPVQG